MLIHFIHSGQAYLPELGAYSAFLQQSGHQAVLHSHPGTVPGDAEVMWWICGLVPPASARRHPGAFQVHEYASASVPPCAWLKDRIKSWRQPTPNYRIFQNAWVRRRFGFSDGVPFEYRDMGVPEAFLSRSDTPRSKRFDFAYLGDMHRLRGFAPLLQALAPAGRTLLLIGELPDDLRAALGRLPSVTMAGRVPQGDVPALLAQARYGLNLVPVRPPYDRQTSTKLLEYCAVGLPTVSTDYRWVREFERTAGARFIYLPAHATVARYAELLGPGLDEQPRAVPPMEAHAWNTLLARLHIWRRWQERA